MLGTFAIGLFKFAIFTTKTKGSYPKLWSRIKKLKTRKESNSLTKYKQKPQVRKQALGKSLHQS
jgi:hypothetical protein